MKKNKLIIFGIGETARLAYEYFTHDSDFAVVAFAVNKQYKTSDTFLDLPLENIEDIQNKYAVDNYYGFVALGSGHLNRDRQKVFLEVKGMGYECASYVSSKSFVWHDVTIGENCFILENNVLQSGVKISDNVTLWSGNHVGHLSEIKRNCFIASHVVISGYCEIGENTFMGVNSCVADKVKIAKDNFIAMGTFVTRSTKENMIYKGHYAESSIMSATKFFKVKD